MKSLIASHKAALALPAPLLAVLLALAPAGAAVISTSSDLPLPAGFYESISPPIHFSNPDPLIIDIELVSLQLVSASPVTITPLPGGDELEELDVDADFIFEITPLAGPSSILPAC